MNKTIIYIIIKTLKSEYDIHIYIKITLDIYIFKKYNFYNNNYVS